MTFLIPKPLTCPLTFLIIGCAVWLSVPSTSYANDAVTGVRTRGTNDLAPLSDVSHANQMPVMSSSKPSSAPKAADPFAALLETARQQDIAVGGSDKSIEQNVCQVAASELIELASPVDGVIENMHAKRGDAIKKGQLIAELQSESQRAQVNYSRLRAEASSAINAAKRRMELAERRLERTEALREAKLMSAEEVDVLISERDNAQLDYETAVENKNIAAAELDVAKAQLENQMIKSPIDGVLITQLLSAGEQVDGKAIALIAKLDPLYVEVSLPLSQLGRFNVGDSAKIYFDGTKLPARIETIALIDQVVEPKSKTFGMRIVMPNPSLIVPAGIGCRIEFLAN